MAQPFSTGPAHVYLGVGPNNTPLYLGTSEGEPEIALSPEFEPVGNDVAGTRKPYDWQYMGEEGAVSAVLTRYNEAVLALAQARGGRNFARGSMPFGSIGAFTAGEVYGFPLWVAFPYVAKAAMAAGGMPAGYHFFMAFDESDRMPVGTKARRVHVQFHCQRIYTVQNGGNWFLYDHNLVGLPAIN